MMPDDGADQTNLIGETLSSNTSQRVQLNIGGNVSFDFTQSALQSKPESMLAVMFAPTNSMRPSTQNETGEFLLPGDPLMFTFIWRHLHGQKVRLECLSEAGLGELLSSCDFYQLAQLSTSAHSELESRHAVTARENFRIQQMESQVEKLKETISKMDSQIKDLKKNQLCGCPTKCVKPYGHWGKCKFL